MDKHNSNSFGANKNTYFYILETDLNISVYLKSDAAKSLEIYFQTNFVLNYVCKCLPVWVYVVCESPSGFWERN